ncbi:MAG: hypothetical protein H0U17_01970 [Actinobacteria bacterium]|nr:hypothetical protein [Actinomycetota bacterium]
MTYDEVLEAIGRGQQDDWLPMGGRFVYKHDLNIRIEEAEEGPGISGSEFHEPWVDDIPATESPKRVVFWVYYGVNQIMEIHTVLVDGRTIVPLPDSKDRFSMDKWNYSFGKIVELYSNTDLGGINSLDTFLSRAGISVRE